ncbi:MAG: hypothetical protein KDC10_06015 [Calditrichaeota bacterium]|nr:hypothetical protein [Calditrichota bacterium]MCB9474645.1 hypothetical protein [Candidatus Delongbacteria bacterium]
MRTRKVPQKSPQKSSANSADERARLEYQQLSELADSLGLHIRIENGSFRSGHCVSQGEELFIINRRLGWAQRSTVLARHLASLDTGQFEIPGEIRALIETLGASVVDESGEPRTQGGQE